MCNVDRFDSCYLSVSAPANRSAWNSHQLRQRLPVPRMRTASSRKDRNGVRNGNTER